jgi:hypothetical protein
MKSKKAALMVFVSGALLLADPSRAIDRTEYVNSVIEILRIHARLLQELADTERFKYSDNLVRHATALDNTFGLLGPMEWHAAQSVALHAEVNADGEALDEATFESLANAARNHSMHWFARPTIPWNSTMPKACSRRSIT